MEDATEPKRTPRALGDAWQMTVLDVPDRYELKYLLPEWQVEAVRDAIRPFCRPDACAETGPDGQYAVHSLYFDTPGLDLYRAARERRARRFKLRTRAYGERPGDGSVFLEVKRKLGSLVRKLRAPVTGDWAGRLRAPASGGASTAEKAFRETMGRHGLEPALLVRYDREAWVSAVDHYARVTFDRRIVCKPWRQLDFAGGRAAWLPVDDRGTLRDVPRAVVLELKCTREVPLWMARVTERLGLQRVGVSKYCNGVERARGSTSPWRYPSASAGWGYR